MPRPAVLLSFLIILVTVESLAIAYILVVASIASQALDFLSSFLRLLLESSLLVAVLGAIVGGIFMIFRDRLTAKDAREQVMLQHRLEAIRSMWEKVTRFTETYYWPMVLAAVGIRGSIWSRLENVHTVHTAKADPDQILFFWYCRFHEVYSRLYRDLGGFFFQDDKANLYADELATRVAAAGGLTFVETSYLSETLGTNCSFYELSTKIKKNDDLNRVYSKFADWAKNKEALLGMATDATYFQAAVNTQIGLLYEAWYTEKYVPAKGTSLREIGAYLERTGYTPFGTYPLNCSSPA